MQTPVLLVCLQRIDIAREQESFKPKLPVCFLCLEKYTVCSPNRGILHQELNFAFAPQELESHTSPRSNVKKARTCQKEFTIKGETLFPCDQNTCHSCQDSANYTITLLYPTWKNKQYLKLQKCAAFILNYCRQNGCMEPVFTSSSQ